MALHLQVSNSLSELAKALCARLKAQRTAVFQPHYIVTQTEGMNSWLKVQLAENIGIAANYRFLKPNDLIYEVYSLLGGKYLQALSPENHCWLLYKLLGQADFIERFDSVSAYYAQGGNEGDLKRMALAEKVADLFDQYQIYRPEMIEEWNLGTGAGKPDEQWQQYLWLKAKELTGNELPDKTLVGEDIRKALKDPVQLHFLQANMPAVHIFGLSVTTGYHIDLFHEIGAFIDLTFHLLSPAPEVYWIDNQSERQIAFLKRKGITDLPESGTGNTLLTSWGKVVQDTFGMLFQSDELINAYEAVSVAEPVADSLLHSIQKEIFNNLPEQERSPLTVEIITDGSLVINSCFTPAREVQVLYNYLVDLANEKKTFAARDVVVMLSDVDAYAPYIRAIFDNAPYQIPYTIADESYTSNDSLAGALKAILSTNVGNFRAEAVMQLLDSGYIMRRFGISDAGLLRKIVSQANIRFGMDGNCEDDSVYVCWKYGIERIMFGICMSGGEEYIASGDSLYPLDVTEGASSQQVIRFCHFVTVLMDSIRERERSRTIGDWVRYVGNVLDNLVFDSREDAHEDHAVLLKQLEKYQVLNGLLTEELSYEVFSRSFLQSLETAKRGGSFAGGGITFCSLIPMRSIPFKTVALMGLNFDKFPRKENPASFNLMGRNKRKGDRNVKENDKHLFLETLLSAGENLYISYIGQSVKDNTIFPPSAMVDELIDYIQTRLPFGESAVEYLVKKHPLHNFSRKYRLGDPSFCNYLDDMTSDDVVSLTMEKAATVPDSREIQLESLISFFKNPVKGYYNNVLSIYYDDEEVLLSDTELFELDHLQEWGLKQQLLYSERDAAALDSLRAKLVRTGGLPLKNMSSVILDQVDSKVSPARELFEECVDGAKERNIPVDLSFDSLGISLKGSINGVYNNKLVRLSWSKKECKHLLDAYIRFLAARACGAEIQLCFVSASKEQIYQGVCINPDDANTRLEELIVLYKEGHQNVLPFWTDFPFEPKDIDQLVQETFNKKIKGSLENYLFPCSDQYIMNKYREGYYNKSESFERYLECAGFLLKPLSEMFPEYYSA